MTALAVRRRPDLQFTPLGQTAAGAWLVFDPIAAAYFQLRREEYFILQALDGGASLEEVRTRFEQAFAPLRLTAAHLHAFILRLHALGLVLASAPGQGEVLHRRAQESRRERRWSAVSNPLAIRLPGFPPGKMVERLYSLFIVGTPTALRQLAGLSGLVMIVSALGLILIEREAVAAKWAAQALLTNYQFLPWLLVIVIVVKGLHELAHALACRHFGGRCREIGVLLLLLAPTLYCDITDAWRIRSRWQRVAVFAAGMAVELLLAAAATWVWWCSPPGLIANGAAGVMLVCSVGTVLFNANPLLRCDGYYILSDACGVPNLWQDARSEWQRMAARGVWGVELTPDPTITAERRPWLQAYGTLSLAYSWGLLLAILWWWHRRSVAEGWGLLSALFAIAVFAGALVPSGATWLRLAKSPLAQKQMRRGRALIVGTLAAASLAFALFVPWPRTICAPATLAAADAEAVYVGVPGALMSAVPAGTPVAAGDVIATLHNAEWQLSHDQARAQAVAEKQRLSDLRRLQTDDASLSPLISVAEKTLADAEQRAAFWEQEMDRLTLRAPRQGVVYSPPQRPSSNVVRTRLASWHGSPLTADNRGSYLDAGTLVCRVGPPSAVEATLRVSAEDATALQTGQRVTLTFDAYPSRPLLGRVVHWGIEEPSPRETAAESEANRNARPAAAYFVRVELLPHDLPLLAGLTGVGRIHVPHESWWSWLRRAWGQALRQS